MGYKTDRVRTSGSGQDDRRAVLADRLTSVCSPHRKGTTMAVKPIPDGYHTVTPYLIVPGAAKLIDFLKQAFDARESFRMASPEGRIMHAEVRIGDSVVMMSDTGQEAQPRPCMIYLYVNDVDATYKRALQAGATSLREPVNQFY